MYQLSFYIPSILLSTHGCTRKPTIYIYHYCCCYSSHPAKLQTPYTSQLDSGHKFTWPYLKITGLRMWEPSWWPHLLNSFSRTVLKKIFNTKAIPSLHSLISYSAQVPDQQVCPYKVYWHWEDLLTSTWGILRLILSLILLYYWQDAQLISFGGEMLL